VKIVVTLVAYRTPLPMLVWSLTALGRQDQKPDQVLVHVNGSNADDAAVVSAHATAVLGDRVVVSWSERNLGFSAAHNGLLQRAFDDDGDLVVVHNPDLALSPSALRELVKAASGTQTPGLFGPLLELADPHTVAATGRVDSAGIVWRSGGRHMDDQQGEPIAGAAGEPRCVAGVSGACMVVPRVTYVAVTRTTGEFFDEDLFAYREDAELCFRAGLLGIESWLVPRAHGIHVRALRGGVRRRNADIDRLGVRNRFLIAGKYGRHRPGGFLGPLARDVVVIAAVLVREWSSVPGLVEAWRLRSRMRAKGAVVLAAASLTSKQAARL
jgi:GT2 family glycosyltransferase